MIRHPMNARGHDSRGHLKTVNAASAQSRQATTEAAPPIREASPS
jgi:hypothetical protein